MTLPTLLPLLRKKDERVPCRYAKWSEAGDRTPYCRERCSSRQETPVFLGVETAQQLGPVYRAVTFGGSHVLEMDCITAIQPPHECNFAPAKRAAAIIPDQKLAHLLRIGPLSSVAAAFKVSVEVSWLRDLE